MFTGLSAFPLTPLNGEYIDEHAFIQLINRLVDAKVNSIGVLGSTGCYVYLTRAERQRITQLAINHAENIPVIVGIGALRTRDVLELSHDAQIAGASGVLLAPVSYQKLTDNEVFELYKTVTDSISIPLCVYDNPTTTHFQFSDELYRRISHLPNVASIKIPGKDSSIEVMRERIKQLRTLIPPYVTIGISGDPFAAIGLNAGCDAWYSVIAGLYPKVALAITHAAQLKDSQKTTELSEKLTPLWLLFKQYGSLRVMAAIAEIHGLVAEHCLPLPIKSLTRLEKEMVINVLDSLKLEI